MDHESVDETTLRRYVLGQADEAQRTRVEERVFASDELFEQLQAIETEIVDEYLAGELDEPDVRSFERQLAASERLTRDVSVARSFRAAAAAHGAMGQPVRSQRNGRTRWMAIAAGLVTAVAAGLLLTRTVSRDALETAHHAPEPAIGSSSGEAAPSTPTPPHTAPAPPAPAVIAVMTLAGTSVRSSAAVPELALPRTDGTVRFQLLLEPGDEYPVYEAQLSSSEGQTIWTATPLPFQRTAGGTTASALVPAARLQEGRYEILLRGRRTNGRLEELAVYRFRVSR